MKNYIRYKGKGEHSVNELEKIIEQREEELHLLRCGQVVLPQADVIKSVCNNCGGKKIKLENGFERCKKCQKLFA